MNTCHPPVTGTDRIRTPIRPTPMARRSAHVTVSPSTMNPAATVNRTVILEKAIPTAKLRRANRATTHIVARICEIAPATA